MSGIGPTDSYRSAEGVPLPSHFPSRFSPDAVRQIDLNGDGFIRGEAESRSAADLFARYLAGFSNPQAPQVPRSFAHFLRHLVFVDEERQSLYVYGVKINLESESYLEFHDLFTIGHALHQYPAGRIREAFLGPHPLRIIVADEKNWFSHARWAASMVIMFLQFGFAPLFTGYGIGGGESFVRLDNTLYITQYTSVEAIIHGFAHYLAYRRLIEESAGAEFSSPRLWLAGLPEEAKTVDEAVQPGLGCKNGMIDFSQAHHVRSWMQDAVCDPGEALSYLTQRFFIWEDWLSKPFAGLVRTKEGLKSVEREPQSLDRWLDTVFRRFVDSGMTDFSIIRDNPYKPKFYP